MNRIYRGGNRRKPNVKPFNERRARSYSGRGGAVVRTRSGTIGANSRLHARPGMKSSSVTPRGKHKSCGARRLGTGRVLALAGSDPRRGWVTLRCVLLVYRWILDIGTPERDAERRFLGYVGSCVDVTRSACSNHALRDRQDRSQAEFVHVLHRLGIPEETIAEIAAKVSDRSNGMNQVHVCRPMV